MNRFKKPLLFSLFILPISIVAGISVSMYQLESMSEEIINEILLEAGSINIILISGVVQSVFITFFCSFFGYILASRVGLWKGLAIDRKKALTTFIISVIGGILFSLDYWIFGSVLEEVKASYQVQIKLNSIIASVLYGGIIEEIMMRLFFMSLIAFLIWKLFYKNTERDAIPVKVFVIANAIAALAFAAGHLPGTLLLFGTLTPIILLRCFLFNGGFGLIFGYLYRKYGIVYSMMSHALFHIVSKLILLLFI